MQKVSVFGLGYVGSVSAACFASQGNYVLGIDVNPDKAGLIHNGKSPIHEPGMQELVADCHKKGNLDGTTDIAKAINETDISFVCVGTPSQHNGKLDLSHIVQVCKEIGAGVKAKNKYHIVVIRSTMLPGTTESVVIPALESASGKKAGADFGVGVNPEFMREGTAIKDFLEPPMTVLGSACFERWAPVRDLYASVPGELFETTVNTAEMVKYACNTFHALKVSFANELGTICKRVGVDTEMVTKIFVSDKRLNISPVYLSPGFAFGGSCLPKDVRALMYKAKEVDCDLPLLKSILPSNEEHIDRAVASILRYGKRKIGLLGLSFKAGTDDLRESPQVQLIKHLLGEGCQIQIWDDNVSIGRLIGSNRQYIDELIPHIGSLLSEDIDEVIQSAEVLLVGTKAVKKDTIERLLKPGQIVIDLVNLDKTRRVNSQSTYEGICW
jgi:GDP-mannose 6-dehydrogenase